MSEANGNNDLVRRLAGVGDRVICRCSLPVPHSIIVELKTVEATAELNENLLSDDPWWEFLD